jgi:acyl-CoA oxidase
MKLTTLPKIAEPDPQQLIWKERSQTNFPLNEMHAFLEGSVENSIHTLRLMQQIERDPILKVDPQYYELSRDEHRKLTADKIARLALFMEQDAPNFSNFQDRLNLVALIDPQLGTRIGVHLGLFLSAIKGNGTDEQFNYWAFERGAIYIKDIYGCFSMTEIAHGSNVAALQTTAEFDEKNDSFIINTPHIGATKWWIGGAAHSATHTVVFARLIVKNKDYGVKTFVVPLRDSNHDILPGIAIGDIGEKMGRDGIDNGWIQFSNVVIPRQYLLSKFTKVDKYGNVEEPPLEQLAYGALLGGRVTMVTDSWRTGERFITIALRYAVGRRQFTVNGEKFENQLINYPLHQKRLLPYLSWVYGMSIASNQIQKDYKEILSNLDEGVKSGDFSILSKSIDGLKGLFADSASLKSTCTWVTSDLIDEGRQSCGGHGYSAYSGFAKGYADHVVQCTWEGDNNILAQNSGRITIQKVMNLEKSGKKLNGNYSFLNDALKNGFILSKKNDLQDLNKLNLAIKSVIYRISLKCIKDLNENGKDWDTIANEKKSLSKLYAVEYIFDKWIKKLNNEVEDVEVKKQLNNLASLFAISNIETFGTYFLQHGIITRDCYEILEKYQYEILRNVREKVVGLTDSFKLSDFFINSVLGNFNGDIYHNYLEVVKNLNDTTVTKAPYAKELLGMLTRSSVAEREKQQKSPAVLTKLGTGTDD